MTLLLLAPLLLLPALLGMARLERWLVDTSTPVRREAAAPTVPAAPAEAVLAMEPAPAH